MQLAGISDPFIHQNHAGAVLVKEFTQQITGAGSFLIIGSHTVISFFSAKLPGKFTPKGTHHRSVTLHYRIAGRDLVAHQHNTVHLGHDAHTGGGKNGINPSQLSRWNS